jgi:negative regulator of sigma E activity
MKDRYDEPESGGGGSEWEPIKILLEGDGNSNKTNTASNTRLRLTTQVGQIHVATGVLLNLGTNFQPYRPENAAEHQTTSPLTNTGQTGEHHRSDRTLLVKLGDFHRVTPHRSGRCNTPVKPVTARKSQNTKQANRAPNRPKLKTAATRDNNKHTQTFTRAKTQQGLHRSDRCSLGSSG